MAKRILGVISGKGGVGKTTLAVNLSALAALQNSEVVLIDGDMGNPSVGLHLGLWGYANGIQNVLAGKCTMDEAMVTHPTTGMRVVPAKMEYERGVKTARLKETVEKSKHENFVIDSPPGVSQSVEDILGSCTEAIIVITPDMPSVMSAVKIIELAKHCGVSVHGLVLNRVQNKRYEMHPHEIEGACNIRILANIPEDRAVPESISARIPVVMYAPGSVVSRQFMVLAEELDLVKAGRWGGRGSGGSIISRIISFFSGLFGRN